MSELVRADLAGLWVYISMPRSAGRLAGSPAELLINQ